MRIQSRDSEQLGSLGSNGEESALQGAELESSADKEEAVVLPWEYDSGECELPHIMKGGSRNAVVKEVKSDPTLAKIRDQASRGLEGFFWANGLILRSVRNHLGEMVDQVVVPCSLREKFMSQAHEHLGHASARKARDVLGRYFWWPGLATDVSKHCRSCRQCQQFGRGAVGKAPFEVATGGHQAVRVYGHGFSGAFPQG